MEKSMDIKDIAYEKYKLHWMLDHGKTISDIIDELSLAQQEEPDDCVSFWFAEWEFGYGFAGEIWAYFGDFMISEYRDKEYMKSILTDEEYISYLEDLKT